MPDHSHDNISSTHANVAQASEGQIWDSLNPDQRAQLLGQSIAGEANNSVNNSVYQGERRAYETTPYTSLPPNVQFEVSNRLHEAGYFQETYGGMAYEIEGEDRFTCKDCDDEVFISEEDFRVHRKINHDDNGESETESQEAYFKSLEIDPNMTKDNLKLARKIVSEGSRVEYPQNDPSTASDPPLPKGRKEYDDNPNHYFYDNKLFKRGSRGGNYEQTGTALTEARALINLEEKILDKYGWESTKDVEKDYASRQVFAGEIAKEVNVSNLHPRTIKILDSVHRPFLVNTLSKLAQEAEPAPQDDAPFSTEEPVLHQDYDPEHPHEHNAFDLNFGDKVAEEDHDDDEYDDKGYHKVSGRNKSGFLPPDEYSQDFGTWQDKKEGEEDDNKIYSDDEIEAHKKTGGTYPASWLEQANKMVPEEAEEEEKEYPGSYDDMKYKKWELDRAEPTEHDPSFGFDYQKGEEAEYGLGGRPKNPDERAEDLYDQFDAQDIDNVDELINQGTDRTDAIIKVAKDAGYEAKANEDAYIGFEPENELPDARKQMKRDIDTLKGDDHPDEGLDWQKGGENGIEDAVKATCPFCGFHTRDEAEMHSHTQDHSLDDMFTGEEDFQFEDNQETTVNTEPDLLQNVNTDVLQVESESYDYNEKIDQKAVEAKILQEYTGYKPKAGEALGDIMNGAIDVPEERQTAEEVIYDRKLEGYHEDKIARELFVYHDIEYEDAIEKIRSIEVSGNDITSKTLFGKKFNDCNEAELSEMRAYAGEVKRSEGVKND